MPPPPASPGQHDGRRPEVLKGEDFRDPENKEKVSVFGRSKTRISSLAWLSRYFIGERFGIG
ncbi:hypothetical protein X997_5719 [Burkholderia pseudomallei A79C]|nr:hypothetical protein X997_5719 [Burkholderia pseudomallei A79C]